MANILTRQLEMADFAPPYNNATHRAIRSQFATSCRRFDITQAGGDGSLVDYLLCDNVRSSTKPEAQRIAFSSDDWATAHR